MSLQDNYGSSVNKRRHRREFEGNSGSVWVKFLGSDCKPLRGCVTDRNFSYLISSPPWGTAIFPSSDLIKSLKDQVLKELGKIAVPQEIEIVSSLPKTRSGKIMRRVLKAKELGQDPGDISTLED